MRKLPIIVVLLLLLASGWWLSQDGGAAREAAIAIPADDLPRQALEKPDPLPAFLPPEARGTLALIASDGPFPHPQDGSVFGNREKMLPAKPRGYYREYTVDTPGLKHRGARRIVTGGQPPVMYYYTADHYDSFRNFQVARDD
jgi:ribonuclease T1